jgi:hypothetical protein
MPALTETSALKGRGFTACEETNVSYQGIALAMP